RSVQNLIDGIYDYTVESCFFATPFSQGPYILLNLGTIMTVQNVKVLAQPNPSASRYFGLLEVKVGTAAATGDFSSYKLLGYLPTMAPYGGFEYNTEAAAGISGRFVS
ncbi:hypothetical protein FHG87_015127, partial [Trinorchestia longiramus]